MFDTNNDLDEREMPDRSDMNLDDEETIPCPYCKKRIYEQSEFCPHCGKFISAEDAPGGVSIWLIAGAAIALAVVLFTWVL